MRHTLFGILALALACSAFAQQRTSAHTSTAGRARLLQELPNCDNGLLPCTDLATHRNYEGKYSGHDEPALAFYSNVPGSGYSSVVHLTLPVDPPTLPNQGGTGGTFNFQLHPAFWFGMALCDTQSAPAPDFNNVCTPDSDTNIFESTDPMANDFVTIHPGTAVMELQFYPPGWVNTPVADPVHWIAALTIDSLNFSYASFNDNNADCLNKIGSDEPINFAMITRSGVPVGPPDPLNQNLASFTPVAGETLAMNPGDNLVIFIHDQPTGLRVIIFDATTKQFGWMTASAANGFAQVLFQPDPDPSNPSVTCAEQPYNFRAMYATSSENTRVVWAAHAFNVGFADELGHFEYCNAADSNANCISAGSSEPDGMLDADDFPCGTAPSPFIQVTGCIDEPNGDLDFDGVSYGNNWAGTLADATLDGLLHPAPIRFSSPRFNGAKGLVDYDRVAFESNIAGIEAGIATSPCDFLTGNGCTMPPPGAGFYPLYSTGALNGGCVWQFGGPGIPGSSDSFGGTAAAEYGPPLATNLPVGAQAVPVYNVFRQVLNSNPCPAGH
ncbi:MAG TPA: hypothetical protein VKU44_09560 [Terriglobia bacterium]|nr:hypothetical protein [Terriglobia bacterium]